ncbi:MAG: hypothetical protein VYD81_02720, partial [Planctomycetota bacterium]|nr:hypothetical protein [Planctomycetota bacterium]
RERISGDYSAGRIDAATALQRLENLLGDNPRIAPSSEKLMKKLVAAVGAEKKENERKMQAEAKAALAAIDLLVEKKELRSATDAITQFLQKYSDFGPEMVSAQRQKLNGLIRSAVTESAKVVTQLINSAEFEKALAEIAALKAKVPASEAARIQSMEAEVNLAKNRMANSLKFVQDNRPGIYKFLADLDFSEAEKQLADIIGKLGGLEKINQEARDLLGLIGEHVSSSKLAWQELGEVFSAAAKSKSAVKLKFFPSGGDDKELRYKVLGIEGHGVRVEEPGSKAPPPVAYRILGLDPGVAAGLLVKQARQGLGEQKILQGIGLLLLLRDGPSRARDVLLDEKIPAAGRKANEELLASYGNTWREARLYSLQKLENSLGTAKNAVPPEMWNFIATDAGVLITAWRKRPDYAKVRDTLHELFLRTRIAALKGASVEGAFNAKSVKEGRDGLTTLQYDFSTVDQLKDFYPARKGGSSIEWVERKKLLKLKGEVRFLAANPFESRLSVTGLVPSGGYNPQAPNINVALWTEEDDVVSYGLDGRALDYSSWRAGDEDAEPPADFFVTGMGYKVEINLGGTLGGVGRLGALARTLTNWLPVYLKESSLALLSVDHGSTLHRRRDEKIWDQPAGSFFRSGAVRFAVAMDGRDLKWKLNNKTINYKTSLAIARLGEKIPHAGSFSLFTNTSTVFFQSLEIVGRISKEWASGLAKSIAERELKKLDPSRASGAGEGDQVDKKPGSGTPTEKKSANAGKVDDPSSSPAGTEELKGLMGQFDKNGDGTLDAAERKTLLDFLRGRSPQEAAPNPNGNQPDGSGKTSPPAAAKKTTSG